jgi:hypothetical protein
MSERIPDLLADKLDESALAEMREHLETCAGCAEEVPALERLWRQLGEPPAEPGPELRRRFDSMLATAVAEKRDRRVVPLVRRSTRFGFSPAVMRFAAVAATLAIGVFFGAELSSRRDAREMRQLRAEMRSLHETVALALLAERSPSERLRGVAYGRELSVEDESVAAALFETMLGDSNVNVRLAALDALRPLAGRASARPKLVAAVAAQESPLVQLSLIDLLLESDRAGARRDLAQLLDNPDLDPVVLAYLRDRLGRRV